ncbi:hypothetical protein A2U01_0041989, partial [Trifolium medium]|nr:hypothetical protein [Trifolium medium]
MTESRRKNHVRHRYFCRRHTSVLILCNEINKLLLSKEGSLHVVAFAVDLDITADGSVIKKNEGGFAA